MSNAAATRLARVPAVTIDVAQEAAMVAAPSPRTPRQGYVGDYRLNIIVAEMQRQVESERRAVHRRLEQFDHSLHELVTAHPVGHERWADLQGSVSGVLEEMSALARRVEGLEEKLLLRTSKCEELTRQRARELEQLLQAQQRKSMLTASTSEELSKRQTVRLRTMGQVVDEQGQRLLALEEEAARKPSTDSEAVQLEARIAELEGQRSTVAEELRSVVMSGVRVGAGDHGDSNGSGEDLEAAVRTLEWSLDMLTQRASGQLDDHAAALASLRIRTEGQEQRLSAAAERLENVVALPLEALRAEVTQSREHDRHEAKSRIEHLTRQLQVLAEANEEAACEFRDGLKELRAEVSAHGSAEQEHPAIRGLEGTIASQEKAIRKLETMVAEATPLRDARMPAEEMEGFFNHVGTSEQRLQCLEHTYGEEELREKADCAEFLLMDAALQELSEPVQRLLRRTARGEARTAALEQRLEQLQHVSYSPQLQSRDSVDRSCERSHHGTAGGIQVDVGTIADLMARVYDLEAFLEADGLRTLPVRQDLCCINALRDASEDSVERHAHESSQETGLAVSVQQLRKEVAEFHSNTEEHIANALERLSCSEEVTRGLCSDMQRLQGEFGETVTTRQGHSAAVAGQISQVHGHISAHEEKTRVLNLQLEQLRSDHQELKCAALESNRVLEEVQRVVTREDTIVALRAQFEPLVRSVEAQLEQLQTKHDDLVQAKSNSGDDARSRLSNALLRISASEDKVTALQEKLEPSLWAIDERLDQLQEKLEAERDAPRPNSALDSELHAQVAAAIKQISACEENVSALQHKLEPSIRALEKRMEQHSTDQGLDEELSARVLAAAQSSTGEQIVALREQLQPAFGELKASLQELRNDHDKLGKHEAPSGDMQGRITEATQRILVGEEKINAIQAQLATTPVGELEAQLQQYRNDLEMLQSHSVFSEDLPKQISEAADRIHAGELRITTVQEQLEVPLKSLEVQLQRLQSDHEAQLEKLHAKHEADSQDRTSEARLKQLQEDHVALAGHEVFKTDLPSVISEVTQRIASSEDKIRTLCDQLEPLKSLNMHVVELKGHEVFQADGPNRIEQVTERLSSNEQALAVLETKLQEAARGPTGAEDSIQEVTRDLQGLRVELGGIQSSVRLLSAKVEEAQPVASSSMERQIRELQTQMAHELDMLARQHLEVTELGSRCRHLATEPWADREIDGAVEQLSKQVLAELQDMRDHQQELGKLRTSVSSSRVKGDNEEGTKKEESAEIEHVLKRMRSGEEATRSLEQRLEQLRSDHEDLAHSKGGGGNDGGQRVSTVLNRIAAGDEKVATLQQAMEAPIRALELQLRQMQNERDPGYRRNLEMELASSVAEVMHRSAENEEANMVLQKQLNELGNASRETAQGTECAIKLLAGKVEQMMQKTDLEENGKDSLGQVQKLAKTGSLGREQTARIMTQSTQVELHICKLQQQVRQELECLARHQLELMESRPAAEQESASTFNGVAIASSSGVEARMGALSKQLANELGSFAEQQAELGQARATVEGLGQQLNDLQQQLKGLRDYHAGNPSKDRAKDDESLQASIEGENRASAPSVRNAEASSSTEADGTRHSREMDTRVKDLHAQVARELQSLSHYQQELEHAQPSVTGGEIKRAVKQLSEQVLMELRALQDHQHELGRFRASMAKLPDEEQLPEKAGSASGHDEPPRMEATVQEVSKQLSDELQALVDQQADLGRAHETIYGMVTQLEEGFGRMADCQRDAGLRQRLRELISS